MNNIIKVFIVDDHEIFRNGLKLVFSKNQDFEIAGEAPSGEEFLLLMDSIDFDVVLMDIKMGGINGIETTQVVKQKYPQIKIIMLTAFDNDENIFNAIKAGADGYLLKEINPEDLHNGIVETLNGGAAMNPSIALKTLKLLRNPINIDNKKDQEVISLSKREVEVLEQLSKGLSYTVIADNLFLSPSTVRKHIENIYKKLQVHSKIEAVQKAKDHNII